MALFNLSKRFLRSLWVFHVNGASCNGCDIEIVAALTPRYDAERFGIKLVGSPRHADVLVMTGPVNRAMADKVKLIYEQTPGPKACLVVGVCGTSGGVFHNSYNLVGPLDKTIREVDPNATIVYVPGCPARPEAIIWGVVRAMAHLEPVIDPQVAAELEAAMKAKGIPEPVTLPKEEEEGEKEESAEKEKEGKEDEDYQETPTTVPVPEAKVVETGKEPEEGEKDSGSDGDKGESESAESPKGNDKDKKEEGKEVGE